MIDGLVIPQVAGIAPYWAKQLPQQSQYEFVRSHIRGMIEPVYFNNNAIMYVHEEGKLLGLPINRHANRLLWNFNRKMLQLGDFIVGTAIVVGEVDTVGEHRNLTAMQRKQISEVLGLRETTTTK